MRVGWVVYGGLEAKTGGTIYDACIIHELRTHGASVEVLAIRPGAPGRRAREILRATERRGLEVLVGDELCFPELIRVFARVPRPVLRVLLVHHLTTWEVELGRVARARARRVEERLVTQADRIVTTSRTTRERLRRELGPRATITVVEPGADRLTTAATQAKARPLERRDAPLRYLFLGSVTRRKRVLELVRAFDGVAFAELDVCGSLERERDYVARVRAAASDRVTFHGERSDAEVGALLAAADVLVMPSSLEGWGMSATEAVRAGVPVIAARSPGLSEALADAGDGAWLVEPRQLRAALQQFASDAVLRERMRRGALGARSRAITWHDSGARFAAVLSG